MSWRLLLATLLPVLVLYGADPDPRWLELRRIANAAVRAGNFSQLRTALLELQPLMPGNARNAYLMAVAEARLGKPAAALARLQQWADMGIVLDLAADPNFASLRVLPPFAEILRQVENNQKPVSRSSQAFAIAEADLIPEDLAWDPQTKRFFISSVRQAKILTGDGLEFARTPWAAFALRADTKRRTLWATTAWSSNCAPCETGDKGKTALLAFDLDSGQLKQRIESPVPGTLGDMTPSKSGDLFFTESTNGVVFHLREGNSNFERLDEAGDFPSPQTPALSDDGKTLYVRDYLRGLAAIDLKSRRIAWLTPAPNVATSGVDGLYVYRKTFVAIRNGTKPPRVIRFPHDLKSQETLEANSPALGEPTHGTLVGNRFFFITNTGWGEYDEEGRKKPGSALVVSAVRRIRLQ